MSLKFQNIVLALGVALDCDGRMRRPSNYRVPASGWAGDCVPYRKERGMELRAVVVSMAVKDIEASGRHDLLQINSRIPKDIEVAQSWPAKRPWTESTR
jgi:hypothetical protein